MKNYIKLKDIIYMFCEDELIKIYDDCYDSCVFFGTIKELKLKKIKNYDEYFVYNIQAYHSGFTFLEFELFTEC